MIIRWRSGLAGFVGASKQFIKGIFTASYTLTSLTVDIPDASIAVLSRITGRGQSVSSLITESGQSVLSEINQTTSLMSWIDQRGNSMESIIDETGLSVRSDV